MVIFLHRCLILEVLFPSNEASAIIQQDIKPFGKLANGKELWLLIYPPLSHFDHLVIRLEITILAPHHLHILGSINTDPLIH
jgi:hypothetical protein